MLPWIVTAAEMATAEAAIFAAGLPVAALMEKAGLALASALCQHYPTARHLGVLVGPGHNGADALVVAREWLLAKRGPVTLWQLSPNVKPLTAAQGQYVRFLGGIWVEAISDLHACDLLLDGLYGWGLKRQLAAEAQTAIAHINALGLPLISIDVPSGLDATTGATWGAVIQAQRTYCLGLWKRGLVQEAALAHVGQATVLDLGVPPSVVPPSCRTQALSVAIVQTWQPAIPLTSHKYQRGHLAIIAGSTTYPGAALLAGLGARPSGVGMVTLVVPRTLMPLVVAQLPEMLVQPYDESPLELDYGRYTALAIGPGLTNVVWLPPVLRLPLPLVLDAGALQPASLPEVRQRTAPTILTPHWGEFCRLYGDIIETDALGAACSAEPSQAHHTSTHTDRISLAETAAQHTQATVILKGARSIIASPQQTWINLDSTPALARGGSGDVLTGLVGGLLAQGCSHAAALGVWWHSQAALRCEAERSRTGVDPVALASFLSRVHPL